MLWKNYWIILIIKHVLFLSCPAVSRQYLYMCSLSRNIYTFSSLLRSGPHIYGQQCIEIDEDIEY